MARIGQEDIYGNEESEKQIIKSRQEQIRQNGRERERKREQKTDWLCNGLRLAKGKDKTQMKENGSEQTLKEMRCKKS